MKISVNAIKEIYKQAGVADFLPDDIGQLVEKIGAQLGEVEEVVDFGKRYQGIVVAKVVNCEKHPNADKLKVCRIDDGGITPDVKRDEQGLVQVVCGAPNVRTGILVAWLPPGRTVPITFDKDPFVLQARELRGVISNGMLASSHELGISDDHEGILEIDKKAEPGSSFAELYKLDDYIIDIENKMFTHRPDCFGLLGVAREIAGIYHVPFRSPDWYKPEVSFPEVEGEELKLEVTNEIPELVPRFCAITVKGVRIGPSPLWLQVAMSKFGIKTINNIVDLTNFYMIYTGQPLHAFDYDKVKKFNSGEGVKLGVRKSKEGEAITVLGGKTIKLKEGAMMVTANDKVIAIGGSIGGAETEIDENTQNLIVEAATWDMNLIRKTSMEYGIFTDAVTRFSKGQSYFQNPSVVEQIMKAISGIASGSVASKFIDVQNNLEVNKTVAVSVEFINSRLGLNLRAEQIKTLLTNVEFSVIDNNAELQINAPFWRTDIEIPEDVVEEVGRLYDYGSLPLVLPKKTISASRVSERLSLKQRIRQRLAALGANEILSYSFIKGDLLDSAGQDRAKSYKLKNALSPELQYYRQSITPSLLEKIHANIKSGFDVFALFELGKAYVKGEEVDGLPKEFDQLAFVVARKSTDGLSAFYIARKYLMDLLNSLGVEEADIKLVAPGDQNTKSAAQYYYPGRAASIQVRNEAIGYIGEYSPKVSSSLKLPEFCAGFELDLELVSRLVRNKVYIPLSRYPSAEQDICLRTKYDVSYEVIKNALAESLDKNSANDIGIKIDCLDIFSKKDGFKQTTFRITVTSYKRTLTNDVLNQLLDKAALELEQSLSAQRV